MSSNNVGNATRVPHVFAPLRSGEYRPSMLDVTPTSCRLLLEQCTATYQGVEDRGCYCSVERQNPVKSSTICHLGPPLRALSFHWTLEFKAIALGRFFLHRCWVVGRPVLGLLHSLSRTLPSSVLCPHTLWCSLVRWVTLSVTVPSRRLDAFIFMQFFSLTLMTVLVWKPLLLSFSQC